VRRNVRFGELRREALGAALAAAGAAYACVDVNGLGPPQTSDAGATPGSVPHPPPPPLAPPPASDGGAPDDAGDASTDGDAGDASASLRDWFLDGGWDAEWWDYALDDDGGCSEGGAFDTDAGTSSSTAKTTTLESQLLFPRSDSTWTSTSGGPAGVTAEFCSRLTRSIDLEPGTYTIRYRKEDGVAVFANGTRILFDWTYTDAGYAEATWTNTAAGPRAFTVLHYAQGSEAFLEVDLLR
jgi:hypothetical protein